MQLTIEIHSEQDIILPINYHHIQQSAIFAYAGTEYGNASTIHDEGSRYFKRIYKLFTFGPFIGRYSVRGKKIVFHNGVRFEVRSINRNLIENIEKNVVQYGFQLGDVRYHDVGVKKSETSFDTRKLEIQMVSPICVYSTLNNGYTNYWQPSDKEFYEAISNNFQRKYLAATGMSPKESVVLSSQHVTEKDKYFTKYKDTYIEAWKGKYILMGRPEYLNFLYDCGLGAKNSQGFGMFQVQKVGQPII